MAFAGGTRPDSCRQLHLIAQAQILAPELLEETIDRVELLLAGFKLIHVMPEACRTGEPLRVPGDVLARDLALGMTLAATFFGGLNVAADTVGKQALDAQLVNTQVDVNLYPGYTGIGYYPVGPYLASAYKNVTSAVKIVDGVSTAEDIVTAYAYNGSYPGIRAIQDDSVLYSHMTLISGRKTLRANETLINVDSYQAQDFPINSTILYRINAYSNGSRTITYNVTLKVVGTVSLDTVAQRTFGVNFYACGEPFGPPCLPTPTTTTKQQSVLITSWEQTATPI